MSDEQILDKLDTGVEKHDEDAAKAAAQEALRKDVDPALAIKNALMR
jgi:methanogenic corrinoid protein MtbC1